MYFSLGFKKMGKKKIYFSKKKKQDVEITCEKIQTAESAI